MLSIDEHYFYKRSASNTSHGSENKASQPSNTHKMALPIG
jgi:hypothetical protein